MQLILLGIIAVIGIIGYSIYKKKDQEKKAFTSASSVGCSECAINGGTLRKVIAKRDARSFNGNEYKITFYFKCNKCGTEETREKSRIIEYKIDDDVVAAARGIAQEEWGILPLFIPKYKVEIHY